MRQADQDAGDEGPRTWPTLPTVKLSVLAAGIRSAATMRGMMAPRVDEEMAKPAAWTATRVRIRPTDRRFSSAWASRMIVTTQVTNDDAR